MNSQPGDAPLPQGAVMPQTEAELAAFVQDSAAARRALQVFGGATRGGLPPRPDATRLTTQGLDGVVAYEPGELTLIARAGARLDEIEPMLAAEGQVLAFEPMDHRILLGTTGAPTLGGMVAANVSGPRRLLAGACRDHLLGVRFVDGRGRILKSGGRVMKNVTGMDLGKLICGSGGTLGVLTEVALKTLPAAESQKTLAFPGVTARDAVSLFSAALATPFEVSGAAFHAGTAWLRIEGLAAQVVYRCDRLAALLRDRRMDTIDDGQSRRLWADLRDVRHFAEGGAPVWRIIAKPTDAPGILEALQPLGGQASLDWGGGLIWYAGPAGAAAIAQAARGGLATLVRPGSQPVQRAAPAGAPGLAAVISAIRQTFDPAGILNPAEGGPVHADAF